MSDNLFSFPGESTGQTGEDIFGAGFTDLGSDDTDNPFAGMDSPAPEPEEIPAEVTPLQEPVPQPASQPQQVTAPQPPVKEQPKAAAPQTTAQTSPASGSQSKPSEAKAAEEPNPLMAAMDLQEHSNAQKAAAPIFAQLPVFSYNGNQEPIENVNQTFEELRLAKADDFPEFDEAQSISWVVTYGKISKTVDKPRKTKIGDFKRDIESSKEFMDALKKATDKHPKCIVKPTVKMQKKGSAPTRAPSPATGRAGVRQNHLLHPRPGRAGV